MQDLIKLQRATIDEHIRAESAKDWEAVYNTFIQSEEPYFDVMPLATRFNGIAGVKDFIVILGQWSDAAEDPLHIGWVRNCWEAVNPWASGAVYMSSLSGDEGPEVVRDAYGTNYSRLAALKAQLDPKNLFRMNQNITPST